MTATDNLPVRREAGPQLDLTGPVVTIQQALELSDVLARSTLVPQALLGKAANIFHVIMTGQALGLHWTEALRVIYSPGPGQIGLRGAFLLSQLRKAGHDYDWEETPESCTFTLNRKDREKPYVATFTLDMAIQGQLAKRLDDGRLVATSRDGKALPWMLYTSSMLFWRAVSLCVTRGAPEVALGFEIEGDHPEPPQPEVMLRPETPAPPEPVPGEAATGDGQAAQVKALDEEARAAFTAPAEVPVTGPGGEPSGTATVTPDEHGLHVSHVVPAVEDEPADYALEVNAAGHPTGNVIPVSEEGKPVGAPALPDDLPPELRPGAGPAATAEAPPPGKARQALERHLAERFTALGWPPDKYRTQMLMACSLFTRRKIVSVRGMQPGEMAKLGGLLEKMWNATEPPSRVVALADAVAGWRESWRREDPDGFARYEAGE